MNGKGDSPRPLSVDQETFSNNWERAFGKKDSIDDQKFTYMTELHSGMFYEWYPSLTGEWEKDKVRWTLARMMRDHVKNVDCEYSGLPSVSAYKED